MSDTAARRVAGSVLAGSGLIALSMIGAAGWWFLPLATVPLGAVFVVWGMVACLRG
jgi:hypothetical protein